ncbi:hypothetical protein [Falcatimonas sp. MSJ-15]|uniref:hypothetical protein n=1 Tax=Falcatimonas sp. MSJ-15 TaxID=2841515 RepID=UPI0035302C8D
MQKRFKTKINPTTRQKIRINKIINNGNAGIGIDLELKDFAIISDGKIYKNINKLAKIRKLTGDCVESKDVFLANMRI